MPELEITTLKKLDARLPNWDLNALTERRCPFCESKGEPRYIRPDSLQIRYCKLCATFFVSPSPSEIQLNDFYSNYYRDHSRYRASAREILENDPFSDVRIKEIASIVDLKDRHVLDVGFGLGLNIVSLKKLGAEVYGIDLDSDAINFAKKLGILNVKRCAITELNDCTKYDLIILHDLIEHPLKPLETLKKARSLVKPNGLISIWTPNASFALEESEPILFRVDLEHMQYLTFRTCLYISKILGLEIVHLETVGFPSLKKIDKLPGRLSERSDLRASLKRLIKSAPGFTFVNAIRKALIAPDIRRGRYHLFCIFRNMA